MMRGIWVTSALFAALACGGSTSNDAHATGGSGGAATGGGWSGGAPSGGAQSGGGGGVSGVGGGTCFPGAKVCPDPSGKLVCITGNAPETGCMSPSCAPCLLPNANSICSNGGACIVYECHAGFADCNADQADGCEANVSTDLHHCGSCGTDCSLVDGPWTCAGGNCVLNQCDPPSTGDCDGDQSNGCETKLDTDPQNCGSCGNVCSLPHAVAACAQSTCVIAQCDTGFSDCDGNDVNGCETNNASDPTSCGACGKVCNATNGASACVNAVCSIVCLPGFGDCDGSVDDGCETKLSSDPANCGSCGLACPGSQCVNGACTST